MYEPLEVSECKNYRGYRSFRIQSKFLPQVIKTKVKNYATGEKDANIIS